MKKIIAINDNLIAAISDYLKKEGSNKTAQPYLIVGESGSGKTFLLEKIKSLIQKEYGTQFIPAFIEGKTLFSTDDIWRCCESLTGPMDSSDIFENIVSWQQKHLCRIVLLIDNIQYYFRRTSNEVQYSLRGKLNRSGAPIVIATSDSVLSAFTDYSAAFFDGFKIQYIRQPTVSDIMEFLPENTDPERITRLMSYLPRTPRSLHVVLGILNMSDSPERDLLLLRDIFSPYCQVRYDGCVHQVQKILTALANMKNSCSLRDIREMTGEDNGKLSPYLKSMVDKNLIRKESKTPRGGRYAIADPLLKLWLRDKIETV